MGKSITLPETNREFPLILSILSFWEGFFPERTLVLGRVVFFVLVWLWGHFGASQGKATGAHFWMALIYLYEGNSISDRIHVWYTYLRTFT